MVNEIVGRINGAFGTLTYVPIHHLDRQLSFHELCALYAVTGWVSHCWLWLAALGSRTRARWQRQRGPPWWLFLAASFAWTAAVLSEM